MSNNLEKKVNNFSYENMCKMMKWCFLLKLAFLIISSILLASGHLTGGTWQNGLVSSIISTKLFRILSFAIPIAICLSLNYSKLFSQIGKYSKYNTMRTILGLDLGTNSIGWAVINSVIKEQTEKIWIEMAGSRIIPMDAAILGDFDKGNSISQTAERTRFRGVRRLRERQLLRRERLHKVLKILGFLPEHYLKGIDFEKHTGKFLSGSEPKLPWVKDRWGKYSFLFQTAFNEMLADFAKHQPSLVFDGKKIPYDWTVYYLRKKALTEMISKEELAWILLNFNQKRGYYQLRGEEEEDNAGKSVEFYALKVLSVEATDEKKGRDIWYNVHLENGWVYRRSSNVPLDWEGRVKEFIVTTDLNPDGTPKLDKYGEVKRSFRAPKEDDWMLIKKRTEADIAGTHKTIGSYIYDALLQEPQQKIMGKLVKTVERKFYKEELNLILQKQCAFHAELQDRDLYMRCIEALYPGNEVQRRNIANRDFIYLLIDDVLFYQRPLKTKKSLIANCPYEENEYVNRKTGEIKTASLKCIAKSHPLFRNSVYGISFPIFGYIKRKGK